MVFNLAILFLTALLAGLTVFFIPGLNLKRFKVVLSFSGAYLFSITVIHILPEIFHEAEDFTLTGIFVLGGFFLQMILEYFSSGVEHGHIHIHDDGPHHSHIPVSLLVALCMHAFLEGTLLVHPSHSHGTSDTHTLLYGLILHKIPEAFALMSVLLAQMRKKYIALTLLLIFSAMSPLGLIASNFFYYEAIAGSQFFTYLFALVAGNFLYISTTIFFETSPTSHKFKANKLLVSVLGAVMAVMAEYFL
ncbi:MAG TPA: ZIP family metal transporter [Cytophagaceae bacterium]